jgi:asparagine synthase (glutamine-hydrolysing)
MCGIWGSTKQFENEVVLKKLDAISFRGPDNTSFINYEKVTLGSARLAIIDRNTASNMPFEKNGFVIVLNGEIYNYKELKKSHLPSEVFLTDSDTEVLLELFINYGSDCLKLLNGMFAFVIYNKTKNSLFGARDRLGKKPLYYYSLNNHFEFASQPKAIILNNSIEIDPESQLYYFIWTHIPDPNSIFKNIKKIPAGTYFTYLLDSAKLSIEKYWDVDLNTFSNISNFNYEETKEQLKELLIDSVKKRIPSNCNFGISLSGGIDSSLITALASTFSNNLATYSVSFSDTEYDESRFAKFVSDSINTKHTDVICDAENILRIIQKLPLYFDEPFADASAIPTSLLFERCSANTRVVLTGDGADELFFGYHRYSKILRLKNELKFRNFRNVIKNILNPNLKISNYKNIEECYIGELILPNLSYLNSENTFASALNSIELKYLYNDLPLSTKLMKFDLKHYLNNDINTKVDRASMFNAIEARSPFMDNRVVDFAGNLPFEYLYDGNIQKKIVKDILRNYLPDEIIYRKKKGFSIPLAKLFRNELKDYLIDIVSGDNVEKINVLNKKQIIFLRDQHICGKDNHATILYAILNYINWNNLNSQKI